MSNFIYQAAQKAIEDAGLFTQGTATIARRGKEVRLELKPTEAAQGFLTPEQRVQLAEEVERLCSGLGDLHVDVLDILVQMHLKQALDPAESALARVDDILQQRGLKAKPSGQGRRGGFSTQQRDEVIEALRAIASLHALRDGGAWFRSAPGSRRIRKAVYRHDL